MIQLAILLAVAVASPPQDAPELDCENAMTQLAMTMCAKRDFEAADAALNAQWDETAAAMKRRDASLEYDDDRPGYFDTLLEAQRAWLRYRDAQCRLVGYDARGGSAEPMLVNACLERLTKARTQALRALLTNSMLGQ